jgi:hypothetical protein
MVSERHAALSGKLALGCAISSMPVRSRAELSDLAFTNVVKPHMPGCERIARAHDLALRGSPRGTPNACKARAAQPLVG